MIRSLVALHSLKTRITLAMLAIFLLAVWLLTFFVSRTLRQDMERLLGEQQFSTASMVGKQVNREFEIRREALDNSARLAAQAMQEGPAALQRFVEQRPALQTMFNGGIAIHDRAGTIIAGYPTAKERHGLNDIDVDVIAAAIREGESTIGRPIIGKTLKTPVIGMAVPIRDANGTIIGALCAGINLAIPNFLDQISESNFGTTGGYLLVSKTLRQIVTATDTRRIMEVLPKRGAIPLLDQFIDGHEGWGTAINPYGQEILVAAKGVPAADWYASVVLPTREAFAPIRATQYRMLVATLALTLLAVLLTWWVLRRQLSPMLDTARSLAAMSEADRPLAPLPIVRDDEVGQLVGGFNRLLKTLGIRESALQQSEENLAITLDSIGDAVIATDVSGAVTRMNAVAERLTACPFDDARGRPLAEVFRIVNAETRVTVSDPAQQVMASGHVVGLANHTVLLAHDGSEYQIADSAAPIRNGAGDIVGVVLVFSDVTARYGLEAALGESEERYRMAFRTSPDAITITRLCDGLYVDVNDGFASTFGWSREQAIGKTSLEIGIWHDDEGRHQLTEALRRDGYCRDFEVDLVARDGRIVRALVSSNLIVSKGDPCLLSVTRDITERKRTEQALLESEARFRDLFEKNSSVMLLIDSDSGAIVDANASAVAYYGYPRAQLLQMGIGEINILPAPQIAADRRRALSGECRFFLFPHRLASGEIRDVEVHLTPIESGRTTLLFSIVNDVTARRKAEQVLEQHSQSLESLVRSRTDELARANERLTRHAQAISDLYDNAPCGYHSLAPDGTILEVNATELALLGYARDDYVGHRITEFMPPDSVETFHQTYAEFKRSGTVRDIELELTGRDGTVIPVLISGDMVRNAEGEFVHTRSSLVDNRVRKAREKEVTAMQRELARRTEAAEAANLAKSAFLSNMSHEIRTPMNAIVGMANLLRRGGVTPQQSERLDKIETASDHLLAVINDILDLSKIEAGKFVLEDIPVSIERLLSNVSSIMNERAQAKGLRLVVDSPPFPPNLQGDPTRLQQAVLNYVTNAIKFSVDGTVTLRAIKEQETDEWLRIRFAVVDHGVGIAPDALPRLFNAFEQADNSTTRRFGGTGLGLVITRRLAELMGGEAGVESVLYAGSTFWFTAKLRKMERRSEPLRIPAGDAETVIRQNYRGRRILLVDDEPINLEVACLLLQSIGLTVVTAENGSEAIEWARQGSYAVILMDMQMPILDGLAATRQIRELPGHRDTPIVAMTANAFAEDKARCLAAGMSDFLIKPFDPDRLFAMLISYFARRAG